MEPLATVHVVDDDPDVLKSLSALIRTIRLKAQTYSSADEFLEKCEEDGPGCLVLDVRMPGMSGLELQKMLHAGERGLPMIILTAYGEVPLVVEAMKTGAVDFFEKPFRPQQLCDAIQKAVQRDLAAWRERERDRSLEQTLARLTDGERQVIELIAVGKTNREIAEEVGLSVRGVENRRAKAMQKLGVGSKRELLNLLESRTRH